MTQYYRSWISLQFYANAVKNWTAAALVPAEEQLWSPAWCSGLKAEVTAVAGVQPWAWELSYTVGVAIKTN